jgi:hypothetical protein
MGKQNTILISELQFFIEKMINNSVMNVNQILAPASSYDIYPDSRSVIRLLFDDEWPVDFSFYYPLFRSAPITECPTMLRQRMMVYPTTAKFYMADSTGDINALDLYNDDYHMLAALLEYKTQDTHYQFDTYRFDDLETPLSKLIYIFLDLKINSSTIHYDNDTVIATESSVIENCYESYIQELVFEHISNLGS